METSVNTENVSEAEATIIDDASDQQSRKQLTEKSPKKLSQIKKRKQLLQSVVDERDWWSLRLFKNKKKMKEKNSETKLKDKCEIFGELVATKLRNLDNYTRQILMNDINTLMFQTIIQNLRILQLDQLTQVNTFIRPSYSHLSPVSPISTSSLSSSIDCNTQAPAIIIQTEEHIKQPEHTSMSR